jgi:1-acyl-sn-glycerol-3-phosphate acyltransferase
MRIKNWTFPYAFGYVIVTIGMNTFYKRHKVVGAENVPKDKPIMFCANHQNAFMDPVLIAVNLSKPTSYLVRADIFKKKIVAKIFYSINMQPIYRERDGVNTKEANQKTFDYCFDALADNQPVIIFPEGNHGKFKTLRSVKKGFARIAKGAEVKHGDIDVQVIPIGLNYSDHSNMGAEMLLIFGEPIPIDQYVKDIDAPREINEMVAVVSDAMSEIIIDIQDGDHYQFIHEMMLMFDAEIRELYVEGSNDLYQKFKAQKKFIANAEAWIKSEEEVSNDAMITFHADIEKMGLRYWLFSKESHSAALSVFALILLFPFHLYGVINNYLPYKIPANFVKKVKDLQFHSSLKMALGVVCFGLLWLIQILIVGLVTDDGIYLYYAASLPASAYLSYHYWIRLIKTQGQLKYNKLSSKKDAGFLQLKSKYAVYKATFEKITTS